MVLRGRLRGRVGRRRTSSNKGHPQRVAFVALSGAVNPDSVLSSHAMPEPRDDQENGQCRPRPGAQRNGSGDRRPPLDDRMRPPGSGPARSDPGGSGGGGARAGSPRPGAPGSTPPAARVTDPALPADVTGRELDRAVRAELRGLTPENAELVARHLVMAARLVDDDPRDRLGARHGRSATGGPDRRGPGSSRHHRLPGWAVRRGVVRAPSRPTNIRLTDHLPVMADCERGLGRPERALELARSPEVATLDQAGRIEMRIVAAGARRDLGQNEAAVLTLAVPRVAHQGQGTLARPAALRLCGRAGRRRTSRRGARVVRRRGRGRRARTDRCRARGLPSWMASPSLTSTRPPIGTASDDLRATLAGRPAVAHRSRTAEPLVHRCRRTP